MADYKFPTEVVDLPSKGYFYVDGHPLSKGKVEVKYMTAKEEDILTSQNLIQQGTVIDVLLQSLIVDKTINVNETFESVSLSQLSTFDNFSILLQFCFCRFFFIFCFFVSATEINVL